MVSTIEAMIALGTAAVAIASAIGITVVLGETVKYQLSAFFASLGGLGESLDLVFSVEYSYYQYRTSSLVAYPVQLFRNKNPYMNFKVLNYEKSFSWTQTGNWFCAKKPSY